LTFAGPVPVELAALKSLTAVGALVPAGSVSAYAIEFVGKVHVPVAGDVDAAVIDVAGVDSLLVPAVKVVEVPVMFQPAPLFVMSLGERGSVAVTV
jgi:hypothetical protein